MNYGEATSEIAADHEFSMAQLVLAWILRQKGVSSAIVGNNLKKM